MEVEDARKELSNFLKEITHFLEEKGYTLSKYGDGKSIGNVAQDFGVQSKEIAYHIKIRAVKIVSR